MHTYVFRALVPLPLCFAVACTPAASDVVDDVTGTDGGSSTGSTTTETDGDSGTDGGDGDGDGGSAYEQEVLADNPWLYYRFDESTGEVVSDSSGNGRDATYIGVSLGAEGAGSSTGAAAGFDGASAHVDLPAMDLEASALTLEAWVNASSLPTDCCATVFAVDGEGEGSVSLHSLSGGVLEFSVHNAEGPNDQNGGAVFEVGEWVHVVATYDQSSGATGLFVNGMDVGFDPGVVNGQPIVSLMVGAQIGGWSSLSRPFAGTIDEFALYDSVLSPERIQAHYSAR